MTTLNQPELAFEYLEMIFAAASVVSALLLSDRGPVRMWLEEMLGASH